MDLQPGTVGVRSGPNPRAGFDVGELIGLESGAKTPGLADPDPKGLCSFVTRADIDSSVGCNPRIREHV